ncbi:MAG: glutamine-synthetase adenylyltransferase, partial [Massilia sp.]|nr:glutamine-synthetase adenylyltransferase [Massilia sp.]
LVTPEVRQAGELGVLRLIDLLEAVSGRGGYVALLMQYPQARTRVLRMLGRAKWAAEYLTRHPILLDELLDGQLLQPTSYDLWVTQVEQSLATAVINGQPDQERQMDIVREAHHAQVFRLLAQDLEGRLPLEQLSDLLSELADRVLDVVLRLVWSQLRLKFRDVPQFAAIAYGKLGGKELGYISDLDVIFLFDDDDQEAPGNYAKLAQRFITWMTAHTSAGILFDVDTALRPDGASGMLVSSVAAFERYQDTAAWAWEHQALTRARFCAGDEAIGTRFEAIREQVLRKDRSDPANPLRADVLKMRARMHDAHPERDGRFDLKQAAGGMIDIEFMVQYLVLRHAARYPQLTANSGNIALLRLCGELGLIDAALAAAAGDAYRAMRKLQHQVRLQGQDNARVEPALVAAHAANVVRLWNEIFDA